MDSALVEFLENDYPRHIGMLWDNSTMHIRREQHPKGKIEIRDKQPSIAQYHGKGVSVINNGLNIDIEIIDFEDYIDTIKDKGQKCDFIINPIAGYDFIIFNELTECEERYVSGFVSPVTGEEKKGKLVYAINQLESSIERFYSVNTFLDGYRKKVALFSCRLTDMKHGSAVNKSRKAFRKTMKIFSNIRSNKCLVHGFLLEQRIYNEEYMVS